MLIFIIYPLSFWYDLHKIESFCSSLSKETKVVNLLNIATDFGVESKHGARTLKNGLKNDDGTYTAFVVSMFTMGEQGCTIKHNGNTVITAEYGI